MAQGFEVNPDRLDGMAARFKQVSQDLNDLGRLSSSAAGVDLQGTPSGGAFGHGWEELSKAYKGLADSAAAIGAKLSENARQYRIADQSASANIDDAPPKRTHGRLE